MPGRYIARSYHTVLLVLASALPTFVATERYPTERRRCRMPDYANAIDRERFIAGLRALAEYLESQPDVPTPRHGTSVLVFPLHGTSEEERAEIDAIAARINAEACEIVTGHY